MAETPSYGFNLPSGKTPREAKMLGWLGGACRQVRRWRPLQAAVPTRRALTPQTRQEGREGQTGPQTSLLHPAWRRVTWGLLFTAQPTDQSGGSGQ